MSKFCFDFCWIKTSTWFSLFFLAHEEKLEKTEAYTKLIDEIRQRNQKREQEATFTEIWYTFVDPYATDVDERGTGKSPVNRPYLDLIVLDDAHKAVGILTIKNGKRIIGKNKSFLITLKMIVISR